MKAMTRPHLRRDPPGVEPRPRSGRANDWLVRSLCAGLILTAFACAGRVQAAVPDPLFDPSAEATRTIQPTCEAPHGVEPYPAAEAWRGVDGLDASVGAATSARTVEFADGDEPLAGGKPDDGFAGDGINPREVSIAREIRA